MKEKFGNKMSKKKHDFQHKKFKKKPMNQNEPNFIKIEKKSATDSVSKLPLNDLKSMFDKLNNKKKFSKKVSHEENSGFKKSPKPKKDYAFELTSINSEISEQQVPKKKRKRMLQEEDEELSPKIDKVAQKVPKKKKAFLETVSEENLEHTSSKKKKKSKKKQQDSNSPSEVVKQWPMDENERLLRTLFVGNLPMSITRKDLEKLFSAYGSLDSARLRGVIPKKEHMPKKVAEIRRDFHSSLLSRKGFVVFKNAEEAVNALALNGQLVDEHHIIVDRATEAGAKKTYDNNRTVFVGNLPFGVEDEAVWNSFSQFGPVEAVRVIRDKETGAGKGFGYVLFQNTEAKKAALDKESIEIEERRIRIKDLKGGNKQSPSFQNNAMKSRALHIRRKRENVNSRKSLKKIMKKEKIHYEKKKIANTFKKYF